MLYVCFIYIRAYTPYRSYSNIYLRTDPNVVYARTHFKTKHRTKHTHTHDLLFSTVCRCLDYFNASLLYLYASMFLYVEWILYTMAILQHTHIYEYFICMYKYNVEVYRYMRLAIDIVYYPVLLCSKTECGLVFFHHPYSM